MSAPIDIEAEVEKATAPPWESRLVEVPEDWYAVPPPNRRWLLTDARNHDEGVVPLAKVGLLNAEGGAGKTTAGMQLAKSVVTGTTWLGAFNVATSIALQKSTTDGAPHTAHTNGVTGMFAAPPATTMGCPSGG